MGLMMKSSEFVFCVCVCVCARVCVCVRACVRVIFLSGYCLLLLCSCYRDKPYLLFFDLTECIYVVTTTVQSILSSNESTLFACPTTQVPHDMT